MKTVFLMRHAKSSWDHPDLTDHERPLNTRGIKAASTMGKWLMSLETKPDSASVSDSTRTQETWEHLSGAARLSFVPTVARALYHASPETLLGAILDAPKEAEAHLIIAHQPGMSAMARLLSDGSEAPAQARAFGHFPTGAIAVFELPITRWDAADYRMGRFVHFAVPKEISAD